MAQQALAASDYQRPIQALKNEMARGIRAAERLLERQKALSYWALERKIRDYLARHEQTHGDIGKFYLQLSQDIEVSERTLQHGEQFYRYFPKLKIEGYLNWSHYRYLLSVPDEQERVTWVKRIVKNHWAVNELRLRLHGLDAPERSTLAGIKAKLWVETRLQGLPFIIVRTYKTDQYDRYLVDVVYF